MIFSLYQFAGSPEAVLLSLSRDNYTSSLALGTCPCSCTLPWPNQQKSWLSWHLTENQVSLLRWWYNDDWLQWVGSSRNLRHLIKICVCWRWEITATQFQGFTPKTFLEVHESKAWWDISSKGIDTLLYLALPTIKKRGKMLDLPLGGNMCCIWVCSSSFTEYPVTFEGASNKKVSAVSLSCSASCFATWSYDADVVERPMAQCKWGLWKTLNGTDLYNLGATSCFILWLRTSSYWVLVELGCLTTGHQVAM